MNKEIRRGIILVAALLFIVLGVLGLALPFLQGFLFLAIGLILLSIVSPSVRNWTERHTRRWPKLHDFVEKMREKVVRFIGEE